MPATCLGPLLRDVDAEADRAVHHGVLRRARVVHAPEGAELLLQLPAAGGGVAWQALND